MLGGCGGGYEYLHNPLQSNLPSDSEGEREDASLNPPGTEEESDGGVGCLWLIFLFIILPEIVRAIF